MTESTLEHSSSGGMDARYFYTDQEGGGKLTLFNLLCLCLRLHIAMVFALVTDDDSNRYFVYIERCIMTHCPAGKNTTRISIVFSECSLLDTALVILELSN